jgi:hypothetical protein
MSHFTTVTTQLKNFSYLKKAVNNLNVNSIKKHPIRIGSNKNEATESLTLLVSDVTTNPIGFKLGNNNRYLFMVDNQLWTHSIPVEVFLDKLIQQYASETIINESKKQGFELNQQLQNVDGSTTIKMQQWSYSSL